MRLRNFNIVKTIGAVGCLLFLNGCSEARIERIEWTTMGTIAAVQTRGASIAETSEVVKRVKAIFAKVEQCLNAHNPNSEICRLSRLSEDEALAQCDETMRPCYAAAFALAKDSGGAFNPRWRGLHTLDFGAIAKGFAVDLAVESLPYPKNFDLLVDLGGNLRSVKGTWRTGLAGSNQVIDLREGFALATSAEYYRGKHIYDGRTGKVVSNEVISVTVESPSAMRADGLSTTLFVLGHDQGERFLNRPGRPTDEQAIWRLRP